MFKSAKEIAYTGMMVALLIGAQMALSAVKGVEIVTAIFALYCLVFGAIRGVAVATAFSLVRCLVFGFFPQVVVLYLVYYNLFAVIVGLSGVLIKNKQELFKLIVLTIEAAVCVCAFTIIDNLLNIYIWLDNPSDLVIKIYVTQSIPVMIGQMICAVITVPLFYYPLNKVFLVAKKTLKKSV